uniref:Uncharacterized protein n=1 Tax=Physcomitrium patens TaxID=3218 RepID=A0A7I4ABK6_PHYPA
MCIRTGLSSLLGVPGVLHHSYALPLQVRVQVYDPADLGFYWTSKFDDVAIANLRTSRAVMYLTDGCIVCTYILRTPCHILTRQQL